MINSSAARSIVARWNLAEDMAAAVLAAPTLGHRALVEAIEAWETAADEASDPNTYSGWAADANVEAVKELHAAVIAAHKDYLAAIEAAQEGACSKRQIELLDRVYSVRNDAGLGYDGDDADPEKCIADMVSDGATLIADLTADHVGVLVHNGRVIGIGDACGAWCVDLG